LVDVRRQGDREPDGINKGEGGKATPTSGGVGVAGREREGSDADLMWEIVLEGMSWVGEKRRLKDLLAPVDSHGFR
jgi:hypothetical protein